MLGERISFISLVYFSFLFFLIVDQGKLDSNLNSNQINRNIKKKMETGKRGRDHLLGEQGKMTGRKRGAKVSTIPRYIV